MVIEHDIGRLDVTKDDWLRFVAMQITQHFADLDGPMHHPCLRQKAPGLGQDGPQVLALHIFNDEVTAVIFSEVVVNLNDGRVTERGKNVGFALEILHHHSPHLGIGSSVEHLPDGTQSSNVRETQVLGLVNGAHAANSQHP